MDKQIVEFFESYKKKRIALDSEAYADKSTWLKRFLSSDSDWESTEVLKKELDFQTEVMRDINKLKFSRDNLLGIASVFQKRSHHAANQANFEVVWSGLFIIAVSFISLALPLHYKVLAYLIGFIFALVGYARCINLRRHAVKCEGVSEMFKLFESIHLKK